MGGSAKRHRQEFMALLEDAPKQPAACPHFAEGCGGCLFQEYSYSVQLAAKQSYLRELYGDNIVLRPCDEPLGYRSRMDFVTAFGKAGLRKRGRFAHVVDIKDCPLLPEHARPIYAAARDFLLQNGLAPYNYVRHEGFLRYIVIRTSVATKQTMLIITTKAPKDDEQRTLVQEILTRLRERTGVESVHWTVNDGLGDISVGAPLWHIGAEHIIDEIAGSRFLITPQTFFQGNPALAGVLFEHAVEHANGTVLDLYCGVGVLSILAARKDGVRKVLGVELNDQSIQMAQRNLALNDIPAERCGFVCADAAKHLAASRERFDTVICDPARPGLGVEACSLLLAKRPQRIIYISCNPLTHKADLAMLSKAYDVRLLEAYDLFPQTPHIEILSVLEKRAT